MEVSHSLLDSINTDNVGQLEMKWAYQIPVIDRAETVPWSLTALCLSPKPPRTSSLSTLAQDASTGVMIRADDLDCRANRGVAILGETLFMSTLDAHLVASMRAPQPPLGHRSGAS